MTGIARRASNMETGKSAKPRPRSDLAGLIDLQRVWEAAYVLRSCSTDARTETSALAHANCAWKKSEPVQTAPEESFVGITAGVSQPALQAPAFSKQDKWSSRRLVLSGSFFIALLGTVAWLSFGVRGHTEPASVARHSSGVEPADIAAESSAGPSQGRSSFASEIRQKPRNPDARKKVVKVELGTETSPKNDAHDRSSLTDGNDSPPPLTALLANDSSVLANVLSTPLALPQSGTISQGITGGTLEQKIDPIYPREAIASHIEGTVVLKAVVAEDGSVQDVNVVSGDQLLASAATVAVKQWRYQPYRLNGKPVLTPLEIRVEFTLPLY